MDFALQPQNEAGRKAPRAPETRKTRPYHSMRSYGLKATIILRHASSIRKTTELHPQTNKNTVPGCSNGRPKHFHLLELLSELGHFV